MASVPLTKTAVAQTVARLARECSLEVHVQDAVHLPASRSLLEPGKKLYVSHLPKQTWESTAAMCRAVHDAGFDPIPHVPVRLIPDAETLDRTLQNLVAAHVREVLLIAGDYAAPVGPYSAVSQVLSSGALSRHGITRVSIAGHPEGHPAVALDEIRRAEREKVLIARAAHLQVTLVTQFFFESAPFLQWVRDLRTHGVQARIVGGLAGPASLATLFRFAKRCGAGPSIRVLGARPASLLNLIGDHGPDRVLGEMAQSLDQGNTDFSGIHLFSFGGFLRTCEWLNSTARGAMS
ncbi:MAG TPA: methylenetetrahydrofolate reductase [Steroidobacteraceae bacterium]